VDRVEDQILSVVRTGMAGDLFTGAADDDLMDIATDPDFLMAEGDGDRELTRVACLSQASNRTGGKSASAS